MEASEPKPAKPARPRAPLIKKTFQIPDYVARQLRLKAAEEGVTERYLVLAALKEAGFDVEDADLIKDGRGR